MAGHVAEHLRTQTREALRSALGDRNRVAFVNFPDIANVGDSLLWLGARRLLDDLDVEVVHQTDVRSFDIDILDRLDDRDPIVINGGGNFGDLWPGQHQIRLEVMRRYVDRPIIQMPQSIWFESDKARAEAALAVRAARRLTIMWREPASRTRALEALGNDGILAPDTAFAVDLEPATRGSGVGWLLRNDKESRNWVVPDAPWHFRIDDWAATTDAAEVAAANQLRDARLGGDEGAIDRLQRDLATQRVARGTVAIRSASVIVTDRLHAMILCYLSRVPVVALDNTTAKVREVYETHLASANGVAFAADEQEASVLAEFFDHA